MKKSFVGLILILLFVAVSISPAMGEDYINKSFPSDEILYKAIGRKKEQKLVGKKQNADGSYTVFYKYNEDRSDHLSSIELLKLDTNIWVVTYRGTGYQEILQK